MVRFFIMLFFTLVCLTLPIRAGRHQTNPDENSVIDSPEEEENKRLAMLHSQRVTEATRCEVPKPIVVRVTDHYPGKYYLPQCTLLHRCGRHSGCCAIDSFKCVAAKKEKVTLYFYSVKIEGGELTEKHVEKLVFTNHTECGCTLGDYQHKTT